MVNRVFTPEQDREIARLYLIEELSTIKLARQYGVDKSTILGSLNRQGIKRRRGTVEPTSRDVIAGMKQFGNRLLTPSEAEQAYKIYSVGGFSLNRISIAYGFGKNGRGLSRALKAQGYILRGKLLTAGQEDEAVGLYQNGSSANQAGQKLGVSESVIFDLLNKRDDVKTRKHTPTYKYDINQRAFDTIENEHAAYWLGFLYADGAVCRYVTVLSLCHADMDHVKKFRDFLESNHRIYIATIKTGFKANSKVASLSISNMYLAQALSSKGIVKGRTRLQDTLQVLQTGLERHFIRGYLDGDGCIRGAYNPSVTFVGQLDLLEWIRATFHKYVGTNPDLSIPKGKGIYYINYCGINQSIAIVNWLYQDATILMERKRAKIDSWTQAR